MKNFARVFIFLFTSAILLLTFQNCSSYSEDTLFDGSKLDEASVGQDPSKMYLDMKSSTTDRHVLVGENQIQVGGVCNPGGMSDNYIEYSFFTHENQPINLGGPNEGAVAVRSDARCENGRFHIVLLVNCARNLVGSQNFRLKIKLKAFDRDAAGAPVNMKSTTLESLIMVEPNSGYCPPL